MAYPPTLPPSNRINATPQADNHPADHNSMVNALSDVLNELGNNPSSTAFPSVQGRLDAIDPRTGVGTLPLFQWGLYNGNTDSNGYARVDWPIAYAGVPASGDLGNRSDCGIICIGARGAGGVVDVPHSMFALGGFNAKNAIVRVFQVYQGQGVAVVGGYVVFHFLVWGPRYSGQVSAGVDS